MLLCVYGGMSKSVSDVLKGLIMVDDPTREPLPHERIPKIEPGARPDPFEDEGFVPLLDKAIAFVILSIPFSALLVWVQELLAEHFSKSVTNIVLLIGIVTFLLSIGKAAKWINYYRTM
jgi:hypothetical protein